MPDIHGIISRFPLGGEVTDAHPYGCGHINDTYLLNTPSGKYILQRINKYVFPRVNDLMENIAKVTTYLKSIIETENDPSQDCLEIIRAGNGSLMVQDEDGEFWRVLTFIDNAVTLQSAEKPSDFYYAARAFGRFQRQMADFPPDTLVDVIPNFHNTASRYIDFENAVSVNAAARAAAVSDEIAFIRSRTADMHIVTDMLLSGALPLRVTHNDTKLNNVLLDAVTGAPRAVIDLDTVMSGSALYDFGDSIRFGTNTAAEDETDLQKVSCDLSLFEEFTRGYLEECGGMLTPTELDLLPFSAKLLTLECGMRFLTDHISGDVYFKIHRENHNLDRARTQFRLVEDIETKLPMMKAIVDRYRPNTAG